MEFTRREIFLAAAILCALHAGPAAAQPPAEEPNELTNRCENPPSQANRDFTYTIDGAMVVGGERQLRQGMS